MSRIREFNNGKVSILNSTDITLDPGETFTGVGEDVTEFVEVRVAVKSDVASATDGLHIEYSTDNVNWDHDDAYTYPGSVGKNYGVQRVAQYYRTVYTNGGTIQGEFRLTTIFNRVAGMSSSHRLDNDITSEDDAVLGISILKTVGSDPTKFQTVNGQHPLPTDGDSVYLKDIDVNNSDNGGFSGVITDYFDSLKTVNNDASATNPKEIMVWFNRSLQVNSIGFGCEDLTKSFSNLKIEFLGSGEEVRYTKDLSSDSTKENSKLVKLPPLAANGVRISFLTTDEIGLSNIIIFKVTDVNARLSAVSDLTGDVEDMGSFRGALNVNTSLVHRIGVNQYFRRDFGASTTLSANVTTGDILIAVVSAAGFSVTDDIRINEENAHFTITDIVANDITLNRPIDDEHLSGEDVVQVQLNMNQSGTLAVPVAFRISPPSDERWQITRLLTTMIDSTAMDDGRFGGASALTFPFVIRSNIDGVITTHTHWSSNQDLKDDMFNVEYSDKAPAGKFGLAGRWTLTQSEFVIDLDGATGDYVEGLVQQDLTVLDDFKIKAQGRLFGG